MKHNISQKNNKISQKKKKNYKLPPKNFQKTTNFEKHNISQKIIHLTKSYNILQITKQFPKRQLFKKHISQKTATFHNTWQHCSKHYTNSQITANFHKNNISRKTTTVHKTLQKFTKHGSISQITTKFHKTVQNFTNFHKRTTFHRKYKISQNIKQKNTTKLLSPKNFKKTTTFHKT